MNEQDQAAIGVWVVRAVALWMGVLGTATVAGIAWRVFDFFAG